VLPLAHHSALAALPVFAPAVVICAALAFQALRGRNRVDRGE
jgi:hypothetical protein